VPSGGRGTASINLSPGFCSFKIWRKSPANNPSYVRYWTGTKALF
jgi:hypothetical protein